MSDKADRQIDLAALHESRNRLKIAMDLAKLVQWEFDVASDIFTFDDQFYALYGTTAAKEGGVKMSSKDYAARFIPPEEAPLVGLAIAKALETNDPDYVGQVEHSIIRADGEKRFLVVRYGIVKDAAGRTIRTYGANQDITERKLAEERLRKALEEKELLLKEIHHRVKNNLMVISSLLDLQSRTIQDKTVLDAFRESRNRARSMALIHERLYRSTDLKHIDFGEYIRTLTEDLFHAYAADSDRVRLRLEVRDLTLDINAAIPLGLIVNELVTNSLRHAFPEGRAGTLTVSFKKQGPFLVLAVGDDGSGFPEEMDFRKTESLGLQLVGNLTEQIEGTIELDRSRGTEFRITFKEPQYGAEG